MRNTQLALLKSNFVLQSAVRDPAIAALTIFGTQDPVEWLLEHLEVEFPQQSEILAIRLRGTEPQANDLRMIVDAVAKAYVNEVVYTGRQGRLASRDTLVRSLGKLNEVISRKLQDCLAIEQELGIVDGPGGEALLQLDMKRLDRIEEELLRLENEQLKLETGGGDGNAKFFDERIAQLRDRQSALEKRITARSMPSVETTIRRRELEQLQPIANEMSTKLAKMDIAAESPESSERIQKLQPAMVAIE